MSKRSGRSGRRLTRDVAALARMGAAVPAATAVTLAHRLPLLVATPGTLALWQYAELWRMFAEKPLVAWQSLGALWLWPFGVGAAMMRTPMRPTAGLELAALTASTFSKALRPIHAEVTANARRLERRARANLPKPT